MIKKSLDKVRLTTKIVFFALSLTTVSLTVARADEPDLKAVCNDRLGRFKRSNIIDYDERSVDAIAYVIRMRSLEEGFASDSRIESQPRWLQGATNTLQLERLKAKAIGLATGRAKKMILGALSEIEFRELTKPGRGPGVIMEEGKECPRSYFGFLVDKTLKRNGDKISVFQSSGIVDPLGLLEESRDTITVRGVAKGLLDAPFVCCGPTTPIK